MSQALPARAGSVSLGWDPVPDAEGYRIYYGKQPHQYASSVDVGNTTEATVTGMANCTNLYMAVKAYNSAGESSQFSNEISGWARPVVNKPTPLAATQGEQFTLTLQGTNFGTGADIAIDNPNVHLDRPKVISCNEIQVAATIEPTANGVRPAEIGEYTLTVVNPDTVFGDLVAGFEVKIDPQRFDVDRRDETTKGRLDGKDTIWLARLFGSHESDGALYDPDSDFNGDGWVDGEDLAYLASHLGECWNGTGWSVAACPAALR